MSYFAILLLGLSLILLGGWLSKRMRGPLSGHYIHALPSLHWPPPAPVRPPQDLTRIQTFVRWMDSLRANHPFLYDSFTHKHPGLLDSARTLDTYYSNEK